MLTLFDGQEPMSRRELLRVGTLGLGGLSLSSLLGVKALANGQPNPLTGKSVIFLFQQGGPSQHETFDPKPDAPSGVRSVGDVIPTSLPGVRFSGWIPRLARLAHKFSVVRSFHTGNSGHNIQPIVSDSSKQANIGVHYARVAGVTRANSGIPTNVVLFPRSVDPDVPGPEARGNISATGPYSKSYAPFIPGKGGQLQDDMNLAMPRERFFERRKLLAGLDSLNRAIDANGEVSALDDIQQQAAEVLLGGGVSRALDLSQEDARTLALYDTSRYVRGKKWNSVTRGTKGYYNAQAGTLGKLLLQARRLCEAGSGYVTIHASYAGVWDMHADQNNLNMRDGMEAVGYSFDHAVAAFIEDCEARGLSEKILLVITGEFGRTPRINNKGGRDHWGRLCTLAFAGGGLKMGQVIGRSDKTASSPASDLVTNNMLLGTVMHTLFDIPNLRLRNNFPADIQRVITNSKPIPQLV